MRVNVMDEPSRLRWNAVRATGDFIDAVSEFSKRSGSFPDPPDRGTDGTLWTDEELRDYLIRVCNRVIRLLK